MGVDPQRFRLISILVLIGGIILFTIGLTLTLVFSIQKDATYFYVPKAIDLRSYQLTLTDDWDDAYSNASSTQYQTLKNKTEKMVSDKLSKGLSPSETNYMASEGFSRRRKRDTKQNYGIAKTSVTNFRKSKDNMVLAFASVIYYAQDLPDIPSASEEADKLETIPNVNQTIGNDDSIDFCLTAENQATKKPTILTTLPMTTPSLSTTQSPETTSNNVEITTTTKLVTTTHKPQTSPTSTSTTKAATTTLGIPTTVHGSTSTFSVTSSYSSTENIGTSPSPTITSTAFETSSTPSATEVSSSSSSLSLESTVASSSSVPNTSPTVPTISTSPTSSPTAGGTSTGPVTTTSIMPPEQSSSTTLSPSTTTLPEPTPSTSQSMTTLEATSPSSSSGTITISSTSSEQHSITPSLPSTTMVGHTTTTATSIEGSTTMPVTERSSSIVSTESTSLGTHSPIIIPFTSTESVSTTSSSSMSSLMHSSTESATMASSSKATEVPTSSNSVSTQSTSSVTASPTTPKLSTTEFSTIAKQSTVTRTTEINPSTFSSTTDEKTTNIQTITTPIPSSSETTATSSPTASPTSEASSTTAQNIESTILISSTELHTSNPTTVVSSMSPTASSPTSTTSTQALPGSSTEMTSAQSSTELVTSETTKEPSMTSLATEGTSHSTNSETTLSATQPSTSEVTPSSLPTVSMSTFETPQSTLTSGSPSTGETQTTNVLQTTSTSQISTTENTTPNPSISPSTSPTTTPGSSSVSASSSETSSHTSETSSSSFSSTEKQTAIPQETTLHSTASTTSGSITGSSTSPQPPITTESTDYTTTTEAPNPTSSSMQSTLEHSTTETNIASSTESVASSPSTLPSQSSSSTSTPSVITTTEPHQLTTTTYLSTEASTPSPEPTTSTLPTTTTTAPLACIPNAQYVYQDIVVVYDLSTNTNPSNNITNFISTSLFANERYDNYVDNHFISALPVFFPFTGCQSPGGLIGTQFGSNYQDFNIRVNAEILGAPLYSCALNESNIDDGLNYILTNDIRPRSTYPLTVIIISKSAALANNAKINADKLKAKDILIATLGVGTSDFTDLNQLATNNSFAFTIANLTNNNDVTNIVKNIADSLASVCAVNGAPTTTTKEPTTTTTVPTTSTLPTTTVFQCPNGAYINEDIAIVYDLSDANLNATHLSEPLSSVIATQFFADSAYNIDAQITHLTLAPFPFDQGIFQYINGLTYNYNKYPNKEFFKNAADTVLSFYEYYPGMNLLTSVGLNDSLTLVNTLNATLNNTVIIFTTNNNGIANANSTAQILKSKGTTIIAIFVGGGNSTGVSQIASDPTSLYFTLPDLSNSTAINTVSENVKTYLLQKSPICGY